MGHLACEDVTKAHVMTVLDNILARGARRLANRTLSELRQMFGFGYVRDLVKYDPTHRIRKQDVGGKETERDRTLSEDEIRNLARKIPAANLYQPSECAIWILLATGCRVGDLMKASWDEINFEAGTWKFAPEKDKTHIKRTHTVFLSDFALEQFCSLQSITGSSRWVFPANKGDRPVCKKSLSVQIADRQHGTGTRQKNRSSRADSLILSGAKWVPHDLRRTAATLIRTLGFGAEVAEACIYHLEADKMKRIYHRHSLEEDMREAWRVLGQRLTLLTGDTDNVVTLPRMVA
jgi:integrase